MRRRLARVLPLDGRVNLNVLTNKRVSLHSEGGGRGGVATRERREVRGGRVSSSLNKRR